MRRMGVDLPAALDQRQRGGILGRGRTGERPCRPLCARRAQGRRREGDGAARRRAARRTGRSASLDDFAGRIDPRLLNRRQIESLAGGGAFDEHRRARGGATPLPRPSSPPPPAPPTRATAGRAACSARARPMSCRSACRAARAGRWPSAWPRRRRASASISPPIRSTITGTSSRPTARAASPSSPPCRRRPTAAAPAR